MKNIERDPVSGEWGHVTRRWLEKPVTLLSGDTLHTDFAGLAEVIRNGKAIDRTRLVDEKPDHIIDSEITAAYLDDRSEPWNEIAMFTDPRPE